MFQLVKVRPRVSPAFAHWSAVYATVPRYSRRHVSTTVEVQRVRFVRRPFGLRRMMPIVGGTAASILLLYVVNALDKDDGPDDDETRGSQSVADASGRSEESEADDPQWGFFLPVPWTTRAPQQYYRGSDPEWQSFVRFMKDAHRVQTAKARLAKYIREKIPQQNCHVHASQLGHVKVDAGRYWLDIIVPDGPPRDYERYGLEINGEYIAWSKETIPWATKKRVDACVSPMLFFSAVYDLSRQFILPNVDAVKKYLKQANERDQSSQDQTPVSMHMQMMKRLGGAPPKPESDAAVKDDADQGHPPTTPPRDAPPSLQAPPQTPANHGAQPKQPTPPPTTTEDTHQPNKFPMMSKLLSAMVRQRRKLANEVPRGHIKVSGLVEIYGSKGTQVVDVTALLHPDTDKYCRVDTRSRQIQPHRKGPRGGP